MILQYFAKTSQNNYARAISTPPNLEAPTTTIRVDLDYLGKLASGGENVQNAFFAGKIRIEGDMNLAMTLMSAVI